MKRFFLPLIFLMAFLVKAQADGPIKTFLDDGRYLSSSPRRWWKKDRKIVLGTTLGIGACMVFDEDIRDKLFNWKNTDPSKHLRQWGDRGQLAGPVIGTIFGIQGLLADNEKSKETAALSYSSFVWTGITVMSLKLVIGRERPVNTYDPMQFYPFEGDSSFPSGHTASCFAAATIFSEQYPHPAVYLPAYGAAAAVGFSRMYANKHWFSDVSVGAVIGTTIAHTIRKRHREHHGQSSTVWIFDGQNFRVIKTF